MKKCIILFLFVFVLLFTAVAVGEQGTREFAKTSEWEPPVIDVDYALENEPWMLVVKTAQDELGYKEGPNNTTKYGKWFNGDETLEWCAEFLSWCVDETDNLYGTDLLNEVYPRYGHPREGAPWFLEQERFIPSTSYIYKTREKLWLIGSDHYLKNKEYVPYPGDYIWFSYYSPSKGTDHVAIVEGVSMNNDGSYTIHVIEGNNPDSVKRNTYDQKNKKIYGYGTPVRRANRVLRVYNRSQESLTVNQFLYENGFLEEKRVKDQLTQYSVAAIKKYQKARGLKKTGEVDMETRTQMEKENVFQRTTK